MSSAVKDMIAKLDAAKLKEEADRAARLKAAEMAAEEARQQEQLTLRRGKV